MSLLNQVQESVLGLLGLGQQQQIPGMASTRGRGEKKRRILVDEEKVQFKQWLSSLDERPSRKVCKNWLINHFDQSIEGCIESNEQIDGIFRDAMMGIAKDMCTDENTPHDATMYPGYGLPLAYLPDRLKRFPILSGDEEADWAAQTLTIREVCMLQAINLLTDKPEWWRKVHDQEIADRWVAEMLQRDWAEYRDYADFTPAMADACIDEIRQKADFHERTGGLIPVWDYSACVIKSDSLITDDLRDDLKKAVAVLENVPEDRKDWHPGSDGKVLDLVHPSLWPLIYGRTRVLPLGQHLKVQDALAACGTGSVIARPRRLEASFTSVLDSLRPEVSWMVSADSNSPYISDKFQWLPCDVVVKRTPAGGVRARIDSYINNVHPVENAALYPILETFIEKAVPAWDLVYRWPDEFRTKRLEVDGVGTECLVEDICSEGGTNDYYECRPANRPTDEDEPERNEDDQWEPGYEESDMGRRDLEWFGRTHKQMLPDMDKDHGDLSIKVTPEDVRGSPISKDQQRPFFSSGNERKKVPKQEEQRIQVIVKLANIHLTPDKPSYDGGSWHVEGQINEHICATAIFYYDSENVTDSHLGFRTAANAEDLVGELNYDQGDNRSIERTFAINPTGDTLQDLGDVLTRPGRALFFPNVYMHRVSPFALQDRSKPGHRKILALFLVDPAIPVLSTANVPPQQKHWWTANAALGGGRVRSRLPPELLEMVLDEVEFPIGEDEAKTIREELMAERKVLMTRTEDRLHEVEWNFCEH